MEFKFVIIGSQSQRRRRLRSMSATVCFLELWVHISPGVWFSVSRGCCALSGWGLCDGPIHRPEDPYQMCVSLRVCHSLCVIKCNDNPLHLQWVGRSCSNKKEISIWFHCERIFNEVPNVQKTHEDLSTDLKFYWFPLQTGLSQGQVDVSAVSNLVSW